jgi:prolyl-tRNA synthetase
VATGKDEAVLATAERIAAELDQGGFRVLLDDRKGVSPGVKFNDSELIGVPLIMVVGKKLTEGAIEVKDRASGERVDVAIDDAVATISARIRVLP